MLLRVTFGILFKRFSFSSLYLSKTSLSQSMLLLLLAELPFSGIQQKKTLFCIIAKHFSLLDYNSTMDNSSFFLPNSERRGKKRCSFLSKTESNDVLIQLGYHTIILLVPSHSLLSERFFFFVSSNEKSKNSTKNERKRCFTWTSYHNPECFLRNSGINISITIEPPHKNENMEKWKKKKNSTRKKSC